MTQLLASNSEKAYEYVNDNARFKRDEGWFQKIGQNKEKTDKEEKQLENQEKKEEKGGEKVEINVPLSGRHTPSLVRIVWRKATRTFLNDVKPQL